MVWLKLILLAHSVIAVSASSVQSEIQSIVAINTTIYSTDPRISYHPESQCTGAKIGGGCGTRYDPWDSATYTSPAGVVESFFRTSSWQNQPDSDLIRHVAFGFRGSAVYIYGAPRDRLQYQPGLHEICIDGTCRAIDAASIYANPSIKGDEPVLLWSVDRLDHTRYLVLQLQLRDSSTQPLLGLTFHHIVLTEFTSRQSSKWTLPAGQELFNVTLSDTTPSLTYVPPDRSWETTIYPLGGYMRQSFHSTSNVGNAPNSDQIRSIRWSFHAADIERHIGTALYIYGAPKDQLLHDPGHMDVCIGGSCHPIDAARIYLNVKNTADPVLLYAGDHFDPTASTYVILRLLQKESPLGVVKDMTFLRAIYTGVRPKIALLPGSSFVKRRVLDSRPNMLYLPTRACSSSSCHGYFNPWTVEEYPILAGINRTYHRTSTWLNTIGGASNRRIAFTVPRFTSAIEIYGAPRPRVLHPHGKQEVCLDEDCYPVDVEQAYMNIEPDAEQDPVLIWSIDGLDPTKYYTLIMKLVDRTGDGDKNVRGMTFSELVYWEYRSYGGGGGAYPYPPETTSTVTGRTSTTVSSVRMTSTSSKRSTSSSRSSTSSVKPTISLPVPRPPTIPTSSPSKSSSQSRIFKTVPHSSSTQPTATSTNTPTPSPLPPPDQGSHWFIVILLLFSVTMLMLFVMRSALPSRRQSHEEDPLLPPPPPYSRISSRRRPTYPKPVSHNIPSYVDREVPADEEVPQPRTWGDLYTKQTRSGPGIQRDVSSIYHPTVPKPQTDVLAPVPGSGGSTAARALSRDEVAKLSNSDIKAQTSEVLASTLNALTGTTLYSAVPTNVEGAIYRRKLLESHMRGVRNKEKDRVEKAARGPPQEQRKVATTNHSRSHKHKGVAPPRAELEEERRRRLDVERKLREEHRRVEEHTAQIRRQRAQEQAQRRSLEEQLLQQRLRAEALEQQRRREEAEREDAEQCVVCRDSRATFSLVNCGHLCVCEDCSKLILRSSRRCPMCRGVVTSVIRIYGPS